ncbi:MAG: VOC family protein [Candidatus Eremiobacteraeota bacterium]|nr:VOC family protein [Candidatus Eremiobacteraeota bacterium]
MDFKLEAIALPVTDIDRAKQFYEQLGWRLDIDRSMSDGFRVVQFTPPGSGCSILFGNGVTAAAPGSVQGLLIVVKDIEAARNDLQTRGIDVGPVYHDKNVIHHAAQTGREPGPDPERRSYASFADFRDPDGNGRFLQEVTKTAPGR